MTTLSAPAARRDELAGLGFDRTPAGGVSWPWLVIVTVIAFAWRAVGLTQQSLWTDEVESLKLVTQPGADPLYVITHNFHGPLEFACLEQMESAVKVLIELAQLWGKEK